jgi:chromosome segregation ATPase
MISNMRTCRLIPLGLGVALFLSGCLQLETPHNFREEEETRIRAKNLAGYYKDLEEQIDEEKTHIKLLQDTLNLYIAREQTLADEVKKREEAYNSRKNDLAALDADVTGVEARVNEQAKKRQELEAALKQEQQRTADLEKQIAAAADRIKKLKAKLDGTTADLKALEAENPAAAKALKEAPPAQEKPKPKPQQKAQEQKKPVQNPPEKKPDAPKPADPKPAEAKAATPKEPAEPQNGT